MCPDSRLSVMDIILEKIDRIASFQEQNKIKKEQLALCLVPTANLWVHSFSTELNSYFKVKHLTSTCYKKGILAEFTKQLKNNEELRIILRLKFIQKEGIVSKVYLEWEVSTKKLTSTSTAESTFFTFSVYETNKFEYFDIKFVENELLSFEAHQLIEGIEFLGSKFKLEFEEH